MYKLRVYMSFVALIGATLLFLMNVGASPAFSETDASNFIPVYDAPLSVAKTAGKVSRRQLNPIHMLVVFTRFSDEVLSDDLPPSWSPRLFDGEKGSITYYFDEISYGAIKVTGECYQNRIVLPRPKNYYTQNAAAYTEDAIRKLDNMPGFSFADYDNDGPDGIPGSGDDDLYVDYLVLMPYSVPYDFIMGGADGVSSLYINDDYFTNSRDSRSRFIKLNPALGIIATADRFDMAVGLISHEYIHDWGCTDLYDKSYTNEETDSAGIGFWGVMGRGITGWNGSGGPVAPSAYSRIMMGIAGPDNTRLMDIYGIRKNVKISDIGTESGQIYRIWASSREYFLVEHRSNKNLYCDRNLPGDGILIWHVNEMGYNNNEKDKLCDLECADGRYADYGYPKGENPDPVVGLDNLDYWAHDAQYRNKFYGNLGDKTDMYDGVRYTAFNHDTNPNTYTESGERYTGVEITNIRRVGDDLYFNVIAPVVQAVSGDDDEDYIPVNWWEETTNLIGLGFQRFIPSSQDTLNGVGTMYIMKSKGGLPGADEILVTVNADSVIVDDLHTLDYVDVHRVIEYRIGDLSRSQDGYGINRENISLDEFYDEINRLGIDPGALYPAGMVPEVQKIVMDSSGEAHPEIISLFQNYPNPFNAETTIRFSLPRSAPVTVDIYSVLGQKVLTRDCGLLSQGQHQVTIDGDGLASGLYLYRITGGMMSETRKMVLLK